jgi:hypothetical protein
MSLQGRAVGMSTSLLFPSHGSELRHGPHPAARKADKHSLFWLLGALPKLGGSAVVKGGHQHPLPS